MGITTITETIYHCDFCKDQISVASVWPHELRLRSPDNRSENAPYATIVVDVSVPYQDPSLPTIICKKCLALAVLAEAGLAPHKGYPV